MLLVAALALSMHAAPPSLPADLVVAQAETADMTPTLDDAPGLITTMVQAVKDKNWQLVVAMAIMLLVVLANALLIKLNILGDEVRKIALPWIAAGTGCLVIFASTLIAGGSWWSAALAGLVTGAAATGLWELVFRHVKKAVEKDPA
ncbi:MAG: hypothetical protein ABH877_04200 [bacterium]